jgi:hypothetical protein
MPLDLAYNDGRRRYSDHCMHDDCSTSRFASHPRVILLIGCCLPKLFHTKSRTLFGELQDTITRLLRLTIQTGLFTSVLTLPIIAIAAETSIRGGTSNTVLYVYRLIHERHVCD